MSTVREQFIRFDALLLVLAVLGFVLFFQFLPAQHPDSAANYELGQEGALRAAEAFLAESGYNVGGLQRVVGYYRNPDLLVSLQHDLGRPNAIEILRGDSVSPLPAYYWRAVWGYRGMDLENPEDRLINISLTSDGRVWGFNHHLEEDPLVDRRALAGIFRDSTTVAIVSNNVDYPDSLLVASFFFLPSDSAWVTEHQNRPERGPVSRPPGEDHRLRRSESVRALGSEDAISLAQYHLARSALANYPFRVDSTWLVRSMQRRPAARVAFVTNTDLHNQSVRCEVEVEATGTLRTLEVAFNSNTIASETHVTPMEGTTINFNSHGDETMLITYVVLVFVFIFLFFRRMNNRLIDIGPGLRDALIGGFFLGSMMLLAGFPRSLAGASLSWTAFIVVGVQALLVGAIGSILLFLISSAADSIARESWPTKIETATLVRFGEFLNRAVGFSLLRGVALSGVLLGVITLALILFSGAALEFQDEGKFLHAYTLSPVAYLFGLNMWYGMFFAVLVWLGIGGLLHRWRKNPMFVISGLVVVSVLLQLSTVDVDTAFYQMIFAALIGTALAISFWQYDVLVCLTAYVLMQLIVGTAPGWLAENSPEQLDAVISFIVPSFVGVIGLVGVSIPRKQPTLSQYVPAYVRELAREERMKRELELAHQVQSTLLPRTMPNIEGLDVAAMCLAAQEVGGDYYDFVKISPSRLAIVVGDVSGKGIQAAFYMTLAKGFLQTLARSVDSPAEVMRRLNSLFCENAPRGMFISMIYGLIDVETRTFTFARAGHNPIIVKRTPNQEAELMLPAGMAIGLTQGSLFEDSIEEVSLRLRPGDVLVLYTDGFSEAMNAAHEQYGERRLAGKVSLFGRYSAAEILRAVSEDVHHFVEAMGRFDDMTMVVIKLSSTVSVLSEPRQTQVVENV